MVKVIWCWFNVIWFDPNTNLIQEVWDSLAMIPWPCLSKIIGLLNWFRPYDLIRPLVQRGIISNPLFAKHRVEMKALEVSVGDWPWPEKLYLLSLSRDCVNPVNFGLIGIYVEKIREFFCHHILKLLIIQRVKSLATQPGATPLCRR